MFSFILFSLFSEKGKQKKDNILERVMPDLWYEKEWKKKYVNQEQICVSMSQYHSAFVPPIKSKRKMMTDEKILCA